MKNSKSSKTVTFSFLFLAINFSIFISPVMAQTDSVTQALNQMSSTPIGNTIWKGPQIPYDIGTGPSILQEFFLFQKDGKVIQRSVVVQQSQLKSVPNMFNPLFNPFPNAYRQDGNNYSTPYDPYNPNNPYASTTTVTPRLEFEAFDNGTYEVNGKTLTIRLAGTCNNCPPSSIVATINGNKIEGELFLGGKKGRWAVEKMSDTAGETSTSSNSNDSQIGKKCDPVCQASHGTGYLFSSGSSKIENLEYTNGVAYPAKGYKWVDPKNSEDFRVERVP